MSLALAWLLVVTPPGGSTTSARRGDLALEWEIPDESCASADAVLDDVIALLGNTPAGTHRFVGHVRADGGYALRLASEQGVRELHDRDCRELARAAALVIAMAIDPTVVEHSSLDQRTPEEPAQVELVPPPEPPKPPTEPVITSSPPPSKPQTTSRPRDAVPSHANTSPQRAARIPGRTNHLAALLGAGIGLFALPRVAPQVTAGLAWSRARARAEFEATYWIPRVRNSTRNPDVGGRFQLVAGALRGCWGPQWDVIELPLCGALKLGAMIGRGTGALEATQTAAALWAALGGGATLLWRPARARGRVAVWARTEGFGALTRPAFATAPSGELWRTAAGALQLTAGVELRFWSKP